MTEPSSVHVLNVNDDEANRYLVSRILRRAGFLVEEAETGTEALAAARRRPPDLVVLDVKLPDMSGFEVCRTLKSDPLTRQVVVLHTSATFVTSQKKVEGLDGGADGYLTQPVEPPELIATVRALLRAREAEEANREAARQWQATFDAIGDGVCLLDAEGRIRQWNRAMAQLAGESTPLAGHPFVALLQQKLHVLADVPGARLPSAREEAEVRAGARWLRISADPLRDANGRVNGTVAIVADVTARHRTEQALRQSEGRFRQVASANVLGLFIARADGVLAEANDAFLELVGYTRDELFRGELRRERLQPPDLGSAFVQARRDLATKGSFPSMEVELVRKDGRRVPVIVGGAQVEGEPPSMVAFVLDITHRKHLEAQLRERAELLADNDRRKDEFLAMLSHELRNPLSAITTSLYLLDKTGAVDERSVKLRGMVGRQVRHLTRLVDDLLDVSRITRGKIQLKKERLDLANAVRQAVQTCRNLVDARGHELVLDLSDEPLHLQADPTRIEQVVVNLVSNAAKYTPEGGRIEVSLQAVEDETGAWGELRVKDNGLGIPPHMLGRVFDLFVQVDQSLARSQGGLGIGLTLVQNLVRMHGGTVSASSAGEGLGSAFAVRLPLVAETRVRPLPSAASDAEPRPLEVMVVEDNPDARETVRCMLELWGHRVRTAADGAQALQLIGDLPPDVAFVDIGLEGADGYEVAGRIREAVRKPVHLVAMTGYGRPEDRVRSSAAGFDVHLVKPVDPKELEQVLALAASLDLRVRSR